MQSVLDLVLEHDTILYNLFRCDNSFVNVLPVPPHATTMVVDTRRVGRLANKSFILILIGTYN